MIVSCCSLGTVNDFDKKFGFSGVNSVHLAVAEVILDRVDGGLHCTYPASSPKMDGAFTSWKRKFDLVVILESTI